MRTTVLLISLPVLAALLCACASTQSTPSMPPPASMTLTPQPCTPDLYTDPYACGQTGGGYYDSGPYTYYPSLLPPYNPGAFPAPPPVKKPPAPPTPPTKPPVKPVKPKPRACPKSDKACP